MACVASTVSGQPHLEASCFAHLKACAIAGAAHSRLQLQEHNTFSKAVLANQLRDAQVK